MQLKREPWMAPLPGSDIASIALKGREVAARLDANPRVTRIVTPLMDMFATPAFLTAAQCSELIGLIDDGARPSTTVSADREPSRRTSSTCKLPRENPLVAGVKARIAELLGLDGNWGEPLQGQRYETGQQFRMHNDYFAANQSYSEAVASEGGQRTWTAMAYLNRVAGGGHTSFPNLPLSIPPTPGVLLIWNNMDASGQSNPYSHHAGTPVTAGSKYVLTQWFREREWRETGASDAHYR